LAQQASLPPAQLWVVERRLRVHTVQLQVARSMRQLYESIDDRVMMMLLTHKVIVAIEKEGFREGRLLLQDWLVVFLAKYQVHYQAHPDSLLNPDDMCPSLATAPRWVYALLRGPLLSSHTPLSTHRHSPDRRTWLYTLYRSLPMEDLLTAVHPQLSAYRSHSACVDSDVALTWGAIYQAGCRLYVLDAYTHIYVYLTAADAIPSSEGSEHNAIEFPPPKTSVLWRDVLALKQRRLRTARVVCCQAGMADAAPFESYIEHDHEAVPAAVGCHGYASAGGFSFSSFLGFLHKEVAAHLHGI